jgi:hypothetical protein
MKDYLGRQLMHCKCNNSLIVLQALTWGQNVGQEKESTKLTRRNIWVIIHMWIFRLAYYQFAIFRHICSTVEPILSSFSLSFCANEIIPENLICRILKKIMSSHVNFRSKSFDDHFAWRPGCSSECFWSITCWIFLGAKNVFSESCGENETFYFQ